MIHVVARTLTNRTWYLDWIGPRYLVPGWPDRLVFKYDSWVSKPSEKDRYTNTKICCLFVRLEFCHGAYELRYLESYLA